MTCLHPAEYASSIIATQLYRSEYNLLCQYNCLKGIKPQIMTNIYVYIYRAIVIYMHYNTCSPIASYIHALNITLAIHYVVPEAIGPAALQSLVALVLLS